MRRMKAYMTLEASMVLPVVLWVIVVTVYLLFLQYDRCLWQQELETVALRGSTGSGYLGTSAGSALREMERYENEMTVDELPAWEGETIDLSAGIGSVTVSGTGYVRFPFAVPERSRIGSRWRVTIRVREHLPDPVFFIRSCRKIREGIKQHK